MRRGAAECTEEEKSSDNMKIQAMRNNLSVRPGIPHPASNFFPDNEISQKF